MGLISADLRDLLHRLCQECPFVEEFCDIFHMKLLQNELNCPEVVTVQRAYLSQMCTWISHLKSLKVAVLLLGTLPHS